MTSPAILKKIQQDIKKTDSKFDSQSSGTGATLDIERPLPRSTQFATAIALTDTPVASVVSGGTAEWKASCRVATTVNIDLSTGTLLTIDGVTVAAGDRILVKDQTDGTENGIYVAGTGAWTRADDADLPSELHHFAVFVRAGDTQADSMWLASTDYTPDDTTPTFVDLAIVQYGAATVPSSLGELSDVTHNQCSKG